MHVRNITYTAAAVEYNTHADDGDGDEEAYDAVTDSACLQPVISTCSHGQRPEINYTRVTGVLYKLIEDGFSLRMNLGRFHS